MLPLQFGHVTEIHPPYSDQKSQRNEDGRYDSQPFHNIVHPQIVVRDIQIHQRRKGFTADVDILRHVEQVIVHIVEEGPIDPVQQTRIGTK